ncbi:MAG: YqgE/AlgH family protein [Bacteroidia bacterium]
MSALQGKLLVALPLMNDGDFKRSVLLLAEHNQMGSLAFMLNKPIHLNLKDVVANATNLTSPLYYGGPVAENQLFYVHTLGKQITESIPIQGNYYWGGNFKQIINGLKNKSILPSQIRFFIGYSGWGAAQLNKELKEKAWGVLDATDTELLTSNADTLWAQQVSRLGANYKVFANIAQEPSLN